MSNVIPTPEQIMAGKYEISFNELVSLKTILQIALIDAELKLESTVNEDVKKGRTRTVVRLREQLEMLDSKEQV